MVIQCPSCAQVLQVDDDRVPPWCSKCGSDLKGAKAATPAAEAAEAAAPADADEGVGRRVMPSANALPPIADPHLEKEWRDRFSMQNVLVGILLTVWGFLMSGLMGSSHDPTDKIFAAHPNLLALLNWLQLITCVNGAILCLSAVGIRDQKPWGYTVAGACAFFLIAGGLVFFVAFSRVGSGKELEDGVAKVRLVRENFDMLIGLVEGFALIFFLYRHRASRIAGNSNEAAG